ncbi:MAG: class I SAM-dependent methyltransferase [Planctomycetota bacterium]
MDTQEFDKMFEIEETNWWYRGRRRLVAAHVERLYRERGPLKILDIACATGMSFRFLSRYGEIRGVDISAETIRLCGKRGITSIVRSDAMALPFREASFDLVLALDALEHFEDDRLALREMHRVLRRDGVALVTVPAFMALWSDHDVAYHHFRRYTGRELREKLVSQNFRVQELSYYSMAVMPAVWFFRKLRSRAGGECEGKEAHSDFFLKLPRPLEWVLGGIMRVEIALMKVVRLPFGVSLFCHTTKQPLAPLGTPRARRASDPQSMAP